MPSIWEIVTLLWDSCPRKSRKGLRPERLFESAVRQHSSNTWTCSKGWRSVANAFPSYYICCTAYPPRRCLLYATPPDRRRSLVRCEESSEPGHPCISSTPGLPGPASHRSRSRTRAHQNHNCLHQRTPCFWQGIITLLLWCNLARNHIGCSI